MSIVIKNKTIKLHKYKQNDVLILIDENEKVWCKGKDVANILKFKNEKNALCEIVNNKYKKTFDDICIHDYMQNIKIHPQTLFISETGIVQLACKKRNSKSVKFYDWINTKIIHPIKINKYYQK